MREKQYKEIVGKIISCVVGYSAVIETAEGTLRTSPVVRLDKVWGGNVIFETENTNYTVYID